METGEWGTRTILSNGFRNGCVIREQAGLLLMGWVVKPEEAVPENIITKSHAVHIGIVAVLA